MADRLAHPSNEMLKYVYNTIQLPTSTIDKYTSQMCHLIKAHKLPFTHVNKHSVNTFELLYMNLLVSLAVATTSVRYSLLIFDDFSRYLYLFFDKYDVASIYHSLCKW